MQAINEFVVSPVNGKLYDNVKDLGNGMTFFKGVSKEDHTVTQRFAEVKSVPMNYKGDISVGDIIVVHHNTFRIQTDTRGRELHSTYFVRPNLYIIPPDIIYMYRKQDSTKWNACYPFIFISPIVEDGEYVLQKGIVEYSPVETLKKGQEVFFEAECEYQFEIDNKKMYRMYVRNITLIESNGRAGKQNNRFKEAGM